jgi:hypothetical protein
MIPRPPVAAVEWTGVAIVRLGRTDRIGHVGGVALISALAYRVVDGARTAVWFSRRRDASAARAARDTAQ